MQASVFELRWFGASAVRPFWRCVKKNDVLERGTEQRAVGGRECLVRYVSSLQQLSVCASCATPIYLTLERCQKLDGGLAGNAQSKHCLVASATSGMIQFRIDYWFGQLAKERWAVLCCRMVTGLGLPCC